MEYCETLPSDPLLKRWSAVACLAGAMERRCWVTTLDAPLYPNMYIMLLAPPAMGKTILSTRVGALWRSTDDLAVGSTSLTKASLVDELHNAERQVLRPGKTPPVVTFNSLQLSINEMGNFITAYDGEFINFLTEVYDCGHYSERRRGEKDNPIDIDNTQITLYGCTTASWLGQTMPEGAWDQGFISRVILVHSGYKKKVSLFAKRKKSTVDHFKILSHDLNIMSKVYGEFSFEDDAADALDAWHLGDNQPKPDHPKLLSYNERRTAHVEKIMMVMSMNESNDLIITHNHFEQALDLILETEKRMPDIFKSMSAGGDMKVIEDCWHTLYKLYRYKNDEPIRESTVIQLLQEHLPSHSVERVLVLMVKSRLLEVVNVNKIGDCYKPLQYKKVG